jgi:stage V sporulation protein AE
MKKRKVILITDGDKVAKKAIEQVAKNIGGRCISSSAGNPTPLPGHALVKLILETPYDPVLVMFDDCGGHGPGTGERALLYVATHPKIEVIGALAVASDCEDGLGVPVHCSIDADGNVIQSAVDKFGNPLPYRPARICGDTVEVLNQLDVPVIVGIGDIGKMHHHDDRKLGVPITTKAIKLILEEYKNYQRNGK